MTASWHSACAASLDIKPAQVAACARLLAADATPPFIVRYRPDQTGGLDEAQVIAVRRALHEHTVLEERREAILRALAKKDDGVGASLLAAVRAAADLAELEDLYAPHKAARATSLAEKARASGLGGTADNVWAGDISETAAGKAAKTEGVLHLLAERVSQSPAGRAALRELFWRHASLELTAPKEGGGSGK